MCGNPRAPKVRWTPRGDKAKTLLAKHEVPRLEDVVARELRAIVAAADADLVD